MSSAANINTKVYFKPGSQVRRIQLHSDDTLEAVKQRLIDLHQRSTMTIFADQMVYQLSYCDDEGDWVTMDEEDEWRGAVQMHLAQNSQEKLFRLQLSRTNLQLKKLNQLRRQCQTSVSEKYNSNVSPLLQQLKEYLSDPQKHQEAKEWLIDLANKIGSHTQEGIEDIQSWINREVPQVGTAYTDLEKVAEKIVDRFYSEEENLQHSETEPQHVEEDAMQDSFILVENVPEKQMESQPQQEQQMDIEPEVIETTIVQVEPEVEQQEEAPITEEEEQVSEPEFQVPAQYADAMKSLSEMGFTDKKRNLEFLQQFKGDMVKTVSALLSIPF